MSGAGNETRTRDPDLGKVVLYQLSYSRNVPFGRPGSQLPAYHRACYPEKETTRRLCPFMFGAGNETRTRDPDLGKVVLYQLSYSRKPFRAIRQSCLLTLKASTFTPRNTIALR